MNDKKYKFDKTDKIKLADGMTAYRIVSNPVKKRYAWKFHSCGGGFHAACRAFRGNHLNVEQQR